MKTSRYDLWELEKVQQIEDENLSTCQNWTSFILVANICAQIFKQTQIGEDLVSSIVFWVLMGLVTVFLILSFTLNKSNVRYALIIMQVSLITSLFILSIEEENSLIDIGAGDLRAKFIYICILIYLNIS